MDKKDFKCCFAIDFIILLLIYFVSISIHKNIHSYYTRTFIDSWIQNELYENCRLHRYSSIARRNVMDSLYALTVIEAFYWFEIVFRNSPDASKTSSKLWHTPDELSMAFTVSKGERLLNEKVKMRSDHLSSLIRSFIAWPLSIRFLHTFYAQRCICEPIVNMWISIFSIYFISI